MIVLKKLLLEHPDEIHYKNGGYDWKDAFSVFSVFRNRSTNGWVGVTLKYHGSESGPLKIITTDTSVNKSLQFYNDIELVDYPIHPNIMFALEKAGLIRSIKSGYEYRNDRPDIPVNGRIWEIKNGDYKMYLVSFWNRENHFHNFEEEIEGCLKLAGVNSLDECLFEFIDGQNKWLTYEEVTGKKSIDTTKDEEETIKQLLKIQHIDPKAKSVIKSLQGAPTNNLQKAADKLDIPLIKLKQLLGKDIAEGQLQENPDGVNVATAAGEKYLRYDKHKDVVAVICIGELKYGDDDSKKSKLGWIAGNPNTHRVYVNREYVGNVFNGSTHSDLLNSIDVSGRGNSYNYQNYTEQKNTSTETNASKLLYEYKRGTHARMYKFEDTFLESITFYISFWEDYNVVKQYSKEIQDVVKFYTKNNTKNVMVQFGEMDDDRFIPFEDDFKIRVKRTKSKEKASLQQALHLMTPNRKAKLLQKLGAMKPNNLQKAADKFGMTAIELRQALGMDIAEGRIEEDPDDIIANDGNGYKYRDSPKFVKYVFSIGIIETLRESNVGWLSYDTENKIVYHNGQFLVDQEGDNAVTHFDLRDMASEGNVHMIGNRKMDGRIFYVEEQYYLSIWEKQADLKFFKHYVEDMLKSFDIDPVKVKFQCKPMGMAKFISYDEMFGIEKVKSDEESEKRWELQKQLHLLPPNKKTELLKKFGAMKPNNLQKAADKFGMTAIELRQALGMDIAENSLGNLSFSDYHDPSIPYEAKPRVSIVPRYGTLFEKFSRKHKKKL